VARVRFSPDPNVSRSRSTSATSPFYWLFLSAVCLAVEYYSGPYIQFPIVYLVPVSLASWYSGRRWGLGLALVLPLFRLAYRPVWDPPWTLAESAINAAIRITVFASFAWSIDRIAGQMRALKQMYLLEGMLGVCGACKKIRDKTGGDWQTLDAYVTRHPEEFTREWCPDCQKQATELFDRR
jgi:hypothetical protein